MTDNTIWDNVLSFFGQASPLILAAIGGLISEYAGLLNIGLEGIMLLGAFSGIVGASICPDPALGFVIGLIIAAIVGYCIGHLMGLVNIRGKANIFIVGLSINLLAAGLVAIAGKAIFSSQGVIIWAHALNPATVRLLLVILSLLVVWILWFFLRSTRFGLRLRVLGNNEDMLLARGVATQQMKGRALVLSAVMAAVAGAALSLQLGAFVPNQSAGKGWIALVLVFVGGRNPLGIAAACLLFVLTENAASAAQAGSNNPALLVGLPFLLVLLALMLVQAIRQATKPD